MDIRVEDNNLLSYKNWSGLTCGDIAADSNGSYWNDYAGAGTTNCRILDIDPFGNSNYIWNSSSTGATTYGGFNMNTGNHQYINCDPTQDYRFSCWFNKKTIITTKKGAFYFGCRATSGTTAQQIQNKSIYVLTNNPYFVYNTNIQNIEEDEWYLLVGYLYKAGTAHGGTMNSAMYNLSGIKITGWTCTDFINNNTVTDLTIRIAPIYEASGCTAHIAYPRIDLVDGTEPSINTLLKNEGMWRSGTTYIKVEDNNLLDYSDWSTDLSGSTSEFTAVTGFETQLNQYRQLDTDPFGNTNYIWVASGVTTTGTTYGGGYISSGITIDNTKIYRISQWCNRFNSGDTLEFGESNAYYFGYKTYDINGTVTPTSRSDGAYGTNFYTYQRTSANMSGVNGWFLTTGYLMPYTWTGNTAEYQGKIYYNNGLTHTSNAYNYKFNTNAKYLATRCYSPYNAPSYSGTKFCYPRIDLVDGTEPSIATLLSNEGMWRSGTTMIYVDDVWKNT